MQNDELHVRVVNSIKPCYSFSELPLKRFNQYSSSIVEYVSCVGEVPEMDQEKRKQFRVEKIPVLDGNGEQKFELVEVKDENGNTVLDEDGNPKMEN